MKIAVASGKGGTGKTTVATNLAVTLARHGDAVAYVDCDVEAPNGHLFLRPATSEERPVVRLVPQVNQAQCQHCGRCARICRFNAIVCLPEQTLVYEELCHSCGGCALVCPHRAIIEQPRSMGRVRAGTAGAIQFVSGALDVGEATSPPVIRAAKRAAPAVDWTILDAPPGTACPMIETVRDCDYVLLVTEPTPFGLHDLRLAVDVAKTLQRPCGVAINRAIPVATETRAWCEQMRVPILAEIPDSVDVAKAYAQGQLVTESVPGIREVFDRLRLRLQEERQSSSSASRASGR